MDENLEMVDDQNFINKMGTERYIEFAEFSTIMSLFNPRTGIDEKINCKSFCSPNLSVLVYFRIFDVDGDGKINKKDLEKVMKMLFGNKLEIKDMKTLSDKIFSEVIASSGEKDFLD